MKCKKCGESLHPEQKVCLSCGTATNLWPGGAPREEKPPIVVPWTPVAIIAGALLIVLVIVTATMHLRTIPPEQVAMKWLDAVAGRSTKTAQEYTTPEFERSGFDQSMSERKADEYYKFLYDNSAKYSVSAPVPDLPNDPKTAVVIATFAGNGQTFTNRIHMRLQGRQWKIWQVEGS